MDGGTVCWVVCVGDGEALAVGLVVGFNDASVCCADETGVVGVGVGIGVFAGVKVVCGTVGVGVTIGLGVADAG